MRLPPSPWDSYRPGLFRLAGFGGAAVFLRTGVTNGDPPQLVLDVGFLTPTDYVWFMRRQMTPGMSEELASFFFACASDLEPELSVSTVHDFASGLEVRVLSSTDSRVELQFEIGDPGEEDGVNFLTSRVALTRAAQEVRVLEAAIAEPDQPWPPVDW